MDFDRERELEDAGIDAFEFSLMDEDVRRQVLEDNFLDPDDYDMIDLEPEFHAWENLQRAGLRLDELSYMDDAEKRSALEDASLDPDDYDVDSSYYHYSYVSSSKHAAKEEQPKKETPKPKPVTRSVTPGPAKPERTLEKPAAEVYEYCEVKLSYSDQVYYYLTGGLHLETGDRVEVPISATNDPAMAMVVSVRKGLERELPFPLSGAKYVTRILEPANGGIYTSSGLKGHTVADLNPKTREESEYVTPFTNSKKSGSDIPIGFLWLTALICVAFVIFSIKLDEMFYSPPVPTSTPVVTATPRPTPLPSPTPSRVYIVGSSSSSTKSDPNRPRLGEKISYKEETYFLGGEEIGGVSTSKFRLTRGSKTYIVYVDKDYIVKRVEDYQSKASTGKSSSTSGKKKTGSSLPASDYVHPEDFYDMYEDDFWDYEDAEDYWEEYG